MSAFDIERIQADWQPIDLRALPPISGEALCYAGYYQIDFAQQIAGVTHTFGYVDAAGFRLACHYWQPQNPVGTVLVGHGYFDHVGLYLHIIRYCLRHDLAVIACDLPGHGLSSGEQASIRQFADYQQVLHTCLEHMQLAQLPQPWHWIAQSTGGAIAMDYLLHTPNPPFDKVVLLAPLVWPFGWSSGKYLYYLVRPFVRHIKRGFAINSHDDDFLHFIKHDDPLQARRLSVQWVTAWKKWLPTLRRATPVDFPLHVIQGDNDTTVNWRKNLPEIQRLFVNADIAMLPNGRHQLVNECFDIRAQIFQQLDSIFAHTNGSKTGD